MMLPSKFNLLGREINVKLVSDLKERHGAWGTYRDNTGEIELQCSTDSVGAADSLVEHSFYHELVHAILSAMGENDLNENEKFVDVFAGLLHQMQTTAKYPYEPEHKDS